MRTSEMYSNQLNVFNLVVENCNDYFGGYENQLMDSEEGSDTYNEAKEALTAPAEEICATIEIWVRSSTIWKKIENLHLVGLDWMRERISKRVTKYQRETRETFPEIF